MKPVQQQGAMTPKPLSPLLHRFDALAHRSLTPAVQEMSGPVGGFVVPEKLEILLQQVGTDRLSTHKFC